jgi:hypothetical protein
VPLPLPLQHIIEIPAVARIRRNHGLEHACIHILAKKKRAGRLVGHSDAGGFWLFGDLKEDEIRAAIKEALSRLRAGEASLAIHPNCGTNLVTSGIMAGVAGAIAMTGAGPSGRDRFERLPLAILFATLALVFAKPAGTRIQQLITTTGNPGDLQVLEIKRSPRQGMIAHRIVTKSL